jgi:N-acyl-D-aspartate/D-glutamate deacylase
MRWQCPAVTNDPFDAMLDLALDEDLATIFTAQLLNSDEAAVGRLLNHPHSLISLSDAGAHLTFFNDAGFGLHLLGHWVRERGAMRLQDAVRRLTHQSAEIFAGARAVARGSCSGPAAARSGESRARTQPSRVRSSRRSAAAAHRCGECVWVVGQQEAAR